MKKQKYKITMTITKNRNVVTLFLIFNFMWILFGWTANTPDYMNYQRRFIYGTHEIGESGFNLIINIAKFFGIKEFQNFIKLLSFILLFLIFNIVRKYAKNYIYVLFLFFLSPFLGFCSGLRNSIAYCIITIAILVLLSEKRHSTICFVLLIVFAFTFHYTSLFFYVLLLFKVPIKMRQNIFMVAVISIVLAVLTYTSFYASLLGSVFSESYKIMSNIAIHARFGMIIPIMFQIFSFLIFLYAYRYVNIFGITTTIKSEVLIRLNVCELYVIPFYFINMNFMRLYQPFMLINTLYYSEVIFSIKRRNSFRRNLYILNFVQYAYLFCIEIVMRDYTWLPFIRSNMIITPILDYFGRI